jgi:hypothetical protein
VSQQANARALPAARAVFCVSAPSGACAVSQTASEAPLGVRISGDGHRSTGPHSAQLRACNKTSETAAQDLTRVTSGNAPFGSSPSSGPAQHTRQKARRVVESNQIDVVAATVFRDREEVDHVFETRTSRQVWRDVGQTDHPNRIHFDLTLIHAVASANLDVGTCPNSDTASDSASSHSLSKPLGEDHAGSLRLSAQLREERIRRSSCLPNGSC